MNAISVDAMGIKDV